MISIALLGYGKMGKAIEGLAPQHDCTVLLRLNSKTTLAQADFSTVDAIVDFTNRDAFLKNLPTLLEAKKPLVVGTTGWNEDLHHVKKMTAESAGAMIVAANFSLGVQLFFRLAREAARLIAPFPAFDVALSETHHTAKLDSPSGTCLKVANEILAHCPRKTALQTDTHKKIEPSELSISTMRLGSVFGLHNIHIDSEFDSITLSHNAKSRSGFAQGALEAAKWIQGKSGFFTIDDLLDEKLGNEQ